MGTINIPSAGNVAAAADIAADNVVTGDDGAKGVKDSGVAIADILTTANLGNQDAGDIPVLTAEGTLPITDGANTTTVYSDGLRIEGASVGAVVTDGGSNQTTIFFDGMRAEGPSTGVVVTDNTSTTTISKTSVALNNGTYTSTRTVSGITSTSPTFTIKGVDVVGLPATISAAQADATQALASAVVADGKAVDAQTDATQALSDAADALAAATGSVGAHSDMDLTGITDGQQMIWATDKLIPGADPNALTAAQKAGVIAGDPSATNVVLTEEDLGAIEQLNNLLTDGPVAAFIIVPNPDPLPAASVENRYAWRESDGTLHRDNGAVAGTWTQVGVSGIAAWGSITGTLSAQTDLQAELDLLTPLSGAGAPSSTPSNVGDVYIDTTGDVAYIATGTASSADWKPASLVDIGGLGTRPAATGTRGLYVDTDLGYLWWDNGGTWTKITIDSTMAADAYAPGEIWGRVSAGAGPYEVTSMSAMTQYIDVFDGTQAGVVPNTSSDDASVALLGDGTFGAPAVPLSQITPGTMEDLDAAVSANADVVLSSRSDEFSMLTAPAEHTSEIAEDDRLLAETGSPTFEKHFVQGSNIIGVAAKDESGSVLHDTSKTLFRTLNFANIDTAGGSLAVNGTDSRQLDITLPTGSEGPGITAVADIASLPDPTTVSGEFYYAILEHSIQYSNGTAWAEAGIFVDDVTLEIDGTSGKLQVKDAGVVATTKLSATGTKDSSTFLRGDDTWAAPSGGSTATIGIGEWTFTAGGTDPSQYHIWANSATMSALTTIKIHDTPLKGAGAYGCNLALDKIKKNDVIVLQSTDDPRTNSVHFNVTTAADDGFWHTFTGLEAPGSPVGTTLSGNYSVQVVSAPSVPTIYSPSGTGPTVAATWGILPGTSKFTGIPSSWYSCVFRADVSHTDPAALIQARLSNGGTVLTNSTVGVQVGVVSDTATTPGRCHLITQGTANVTSGAFWVDMQAPSGCTVNSWSLTMMPIAAVGTW